MNPEEQGRKLSQIIAKCWADEGFKRKLLADPATMLTAEGLEVPAGFSIKAVEDNDKVRHLVIPARPDELSDEDLDRVAGGVKTGLDAAAWGGKVAGGTGGSGGSGGGGWTCGPTCVPGMGGGGSSCGGCGF